MNGVARSFLLLVVLSVAVTVAAPLYAGCVWFVESVGYVTTYGWTGLGGRIPLATSVHVTWSQQCSWDDPIYLPPHPEGPSAPIQRRIYAEIQEINTTNPDRPVLTAEVWSDDQFAPPNQILLLINGYAHATVAVSGNGFYNLYLPAMSQFADGVTGIDVEACNADMRCAIGYSQLHKYTQPAEASSLMEAYRLSGDDWIRSEYQHLFKQAYATAAFTVPEVGENSRRQLKGNSTTVTWQNPNPKVIFSAAARSSGTVYNSTAYLGWCDQSPVMCYTQNCRSKCGWFGTFGMYPTLNEWIDDFVTEEFRPIAISTGGELYLGIP